MQIERKFEVCSQTMNRSFKTLIKWLIISTLSLKASFVQATPPKSDPDQEISEFLNECSSKLKAQNQDKRTVFAEKNPKGTRTFYLVDHEKFYINMFIHFRAESFVGTERAHLIPSIQPLVTEALDLSEQFYRKHGLHLTIHPTFDESQLYMPPPVPEISKLVYIRPFRNAMNSLRWGLNPSWDAEQRSKIYTHEMTHFFGLKDEYYKESGIYVTDELGEEDSFMRNWDHPNARMYVSQVKEILQYLCK